MPAKSQKNGTPRKQPDAVGLPEDVAAIRAEIQKFFKTKDDHGRRIGSYKHGVYAFYDYDVEPIYVGQTEEKLSGRVSRHLTNQRTDAVAMNVLDPFEVAYIEVWPLDALMSGLPKKGKKALLDQAEYTVFQKVLRESALGAVLNEKEMAPRNEIQLPQSHKQRIIPDAIYKQRRHPDFAALGICCGLFERFIDSSLKQTDTKAAPEAFRKTAAQDLGCSQDAVERFWDGYRLGIQHAFQPKSYIEDEGKGDRWGWEMAEADGFHHYPEIIKQDSKTFILRIDPWKFVDHVLKRWKENPDLLNVLSEFVLGNIAPITPRPSQSTSHHTTSPSSAYRSYQNPPNWPTSTGNQP